MTQNTPMNPRPLSPHMQVYRWTFTMALSILHRITGFGLALGAPLMVWWLIALLKGDEAFQQFHDFTHSLLGQLMLSCWLFGLIYHSLNGIRHMVWDAGYNITKGGAKASGAIVLVATLLLTAALWCWAGQCWTGQ